MKITIPAPCHENWEAMAPEEKGRYCAVCSKTVMDFTTASDDEIADVFSHSTENICGNFYESQLNRDLQYSYINALFSKFAVGFILTTAGFISVDAQQEIPNDTLKAGKIEEVILPALTKTTHRTVVGASAIVPGDTLICTTGDSNKEAPPKIPGLQVSQAPNKSLDKSEIRIGGAHATLRDDQKPLAVVNGKLISIDELRAIDPDSIESFTVLNGDSATEMFGDRGKNGIIMVTTKKKWKRNKQKTSEK